MSKSLKDVITDAAEELGWTVRFETQRRTLYNGGAWDKEKTEKYVEFSQYSPAGEDFDFTVFYDSLGEMAKKVYEAYDDFDVDDHVRMWLEAASNGVGGVPGAVTLAHDAEAIEQMILDLAMALRDALGKRGVW